MDHSNEAVSRVTVPSLLERKLRGEKITCLTAYDYPTARLVDEARLRTGEYAIDLVLVGDSLAQVVLGYDSTLPVTVAEMLHHVRAVRRGLRRCLLVADMPYGAFHRSGDDTLANALRFVKEGGAEAVKIEGGERRSSLIRRLIEAEIPVMGHLGLTPQSVNTQGGYRVQGMNLESSERILNDALALEAAGVFAVVLEGVPRELAALITARLRIPTIGIGAGPDCDGQILVLHDLLGFSYGPPAKFVRPYMSLRQEAGEALGRFAEDVRTGGYPADRESYHWSRAVREQFEERPARRR